MCHFNAHIKSFTPLFHIHNTDVSIIYECNRYWFYTKTPQRKYPMYHSYKAYEYPQRYSFTVARFMATMIARSSQERSQLLDPKIQLSLLDLKYVKLHFLLCVMLQWCQVKKYKYITSVLMYLLSFRK